jgi:hypothetical protein
MREGRQPGRLRDVVRAVRIEDEGPGEPADEAILREQVVLVAGSLGLAHRRLGGI